MRSFLKFLAWAGGILGVIVLILYLGVFEVWRVPGDDAQFAASILPGLEAGDLLLVSRHGMPSFGQLARCVDPDQPGRFVVGRLVGQQGDVVELKDESLYVNNKHEVSPGSCDDPKRVVVNPANQDELSLRCMREEFAGMTHGVLTSEGDERPEPSISVTVDRARIYLLSDNRHVHQDSRDYGQINPATCQHLAYRLWSAKGISDSEHRFSFIW